jgi:dienelactone hydrolase
MLNKSDSHTMRLRVTAIVLCCATQALADGLADNLPDKVRRIPQPGIEVPAERADALRQQLQALDKQIAALAAHGDPRVADLLPDVQIYAKAVQDALEFNEFFDIKELDVADELLREGQERATQLAEGQAPWTTATGLVALGYVSRIDGSVQPYGLVVPESYQAAGQVRHRLDVWFHGRGEVLSELNFVQGRRKQIGQFAPRDTLVLHPYGRYCNAFKFAGETDVLETLAEVERRYRVDRELISVRGFSMGGAACWHFAVHHSDRWFAANPGAGFSETPEFLRHFQKEAAQPTWFERKLFHLYDCTDWAPNLFHCPTVAYSGEKDTQKQAADAMEKALLESGIRLRHVIGPQTAHSYHPDSAAEVERSMDSLAEIGRDRFPTAVHLVTYTLKYDRMSWVTVEGVSEHWQRSAVEATLADASSVDVFTDNVTDLAFDFPAGWCPLDVDQPVLAIIDNQEIRLPQPLSDRSWHAQLHLADGKWEAGARPAEGLRKRHDLQGPIDDAFMDRFLFVRPSGNAAHEGAGKWALAELDRAIEHWRRHFRGVAPVKQDSEVSDDDIANSNLVLWGDPSSNRLLAKIVDQLPIVWKKDEITVAERRFAADDHALIMIYPNPLNPRRYVVLNSGFTFRDYAYLNNARQVPKLPDWAVIDLRTPPNSLWPGKVAAAGFFDEAWRLKPEEE